MVGKSKGKKSRETAFARDQNVRLPPAEEDRRSALQLMKRPSVLCMVAEHLVLALTKMCLEAGVSKWC